MKRGNEGRVCGVCVCMCMCVGGGEGGVRDLGKGRGIIAGLVPFGFGALPPRRERGPQGCGGAPGDDELSEPCEARGGTREVPWQRGAVERRAFILYTSSGGKRARRVRRRARFACDFKRLAFRQGRVFKAFCGAFP